jgi:hypothetical protein
MKQHITAVITAAILLLDPLPAEAYGTFSYTETRYGELEITIDRGRFGGFLLVTDGSAEQETLAAVKGVSSVIPLTGDNYSSYEYTRNTVNGFSRYGDRAVLWLVFLKPAYTEILMEYAQDYTILIDGALDALCLDYTDYSTGYWNGGLHTSYFGMKADEERLMQQLEVEERAAACYAAWREELEAWEAAVSAEEMARPQYLKARKEAGILSEYEMTQVGESYAEEMEELYSDADSVRCTLDFTFDETKRRFDGVSVWGYIGDCNLDDKVDAQDAAALLSFAAADGAGSGFLFTSEQLDAADVNRNGVINASDASIILRYAAGTGAESVEAIFQYWK